MNGVPSSSPAPSGSVRPTSARRASSRNAGRFLLAMATVAFPGCIDSIDPDEFRIVGHIPAEVLAGGSLEPQIPETAIAGVPLQIKVWTFHSCARNAGIEVSEYGGSAEATPYISTMVEGACTLVSEPIEHRAELVFRYTRESEVVLRYSTAQGGSWKANGTMVYKVTVSPEG